MNPFRNRQAVTSILSASLLLLALFPARLAASALILAWDANTEADLAGYRIYYGTQSGDYDSIEDAGNVTQYTVTGLEPKTRYYLALTAYDNLWQESDFSEEVSAITNEELAPLPSPVQISSEDGYSEWGCFIATMAYGSYLNANVKVLRSFRDEFLISNSLGRKFVHMYYQYGPRIVNHIGEYGFLRFLTRQALLPLIGMSSLSLKTTASQKILLLAICLILILTLILSSHRRQIL